MFTTLTTLHDIAKGNETECRLSPGLKTYLAFLSGENKPRGPNKKVYW